MEVYVKIGFLHSENHMPLSSEGMMVSKGDHTKLWLAYEVTEMMEV